MKFLKKMKSHLIIITILILIAGLTEGIVYFNFDKLREAPIGFGDFIRIYPFYNKNGSFVHGITGIGYVRWLLFLEDIIVLLMEAFLFRFIKAYGRFFHMSMLWLHLTDFAFAAAIYRIITRIRGALTLDYFALGKYIYDFPDLYLNILIAGVLIWLIPALIKWYSYRRAKVKGLSFIKKQIWDFKFSGIFFKAAVIPESRWENEFEAWR